MHFLREDSRNSIPTAVIVALCSLPPTTEVGSIEITLEGSNETGFRDTTDPEMRRPGLVIDGQHRLFGVSAYDPAMKVPVVALMNPNDEEIAFQFLVINSKASRVSRDHIRALAIEFREDELRNRLKKTARLTLSPHLDLVEFLDTEKESPFFGLLAWPANRNGDQRIPPNAVETALAYVQRSLPDFEDADVLLEFFAALWRTARVAWPQHWEPNTDSRLLSKVGIVCMTTYMTDRLISQYDLDTLDIGDVDEVERATARLLAHQRPEFWTAQWTSSSYDTKVGRQLIVDSLVQIARNTRASAAWYAHVPVLADAFQDE